MKHKQTSISNNTSNNNIIPYNYVGTSLSYKNKSFIYLSFPNWQNLTIHKRNIICLNENITNIKFCLDFANLKSNISYNGIYFIDSNIVNNKNNQINYLYPQDNNFKNSSMHTKC